jgi:lauroyl/myristoyl acyltransferase
LHSDGQQKRVEKLEIMTGVIKNAIEEFARRMKKVVLKIAFRLPIKSCRFFFVLLVSTFWYVYTGRKIIGNILRYKEALNNSQKNIVFLFNYFLNKTYDRIFPHLIAENPGKYLKYVCIEGEEYVRRIMDNDRGVILISGHFGHMFTQLLFREAFGISISAFASAEQRKIFCNSSEKINKIISSLPIYAVGEEKQFQEGLLRKEWIAFLNDVPVAKRSSHRRTLFGKKIYFSELPFKLSIKHSIPIIFVGITIIKRQYIFSILPIDGFYTQEEGLEKYITLIEKFLLRDPYVGSYIAEHYFHKDLL